MGSEERARRREHKRQKRAKAVDAGSVSHLTQKIVDHLKVKFYNADADEAKEFSVAELKDKFGEDRSNIMSVIRIFEGLEIVKKVKISFVDYSALRLDLHNRAASAVDGVNKRGIFHLMIKPRVPGFELGVRYCWPYMITLTRVFEAFK